MIEIVRRPCFVLGDLNRSPAFVCSNDRSTRIFPASRSTSCHLKASSSPRRIPVRKPGLGAQHAVDAVATELGIPAATVAAGTVDQMYLPAL